MAFVVLWFGLFSFFTFYIYIIDKQKDFQRQEEIDIKKQQKICSVKVSPSFKI